MRTLFFALVLFPALASAQTAPEAASPVTLFKPAPEADRLWRIAASGGPAGSLLNAGAFVSVERRVAGALGVGARAGYYSSVGPFSAQSDGGNMTGASGEAFASVSTSGRPFRLSASLGGGIATLDYYSGGLVYECFPEDDFCPPQTGGSFEGTRGYAVASVGADVLLTPALGIGAEIRAATMTEEANVSSFALGLRVRL